MRAHLRAALLAAVFALVFAAGLPGQALAGTGTTGGLNTEQRAVLQGIAAEGQACSAILPCGPGLFCLAMSASISTCAKFCASDENAT